MEEMPKKEISNKLHKLILTGRSYKISKGQIVQSSDDRYQPLVNLIKSGYVKSYEINNDGSLAIQSIYGPGTVFPLSLIYETLLGQKIYDGPEIIYYETMTDTEICSISPQTLADAARQDYIIYRDLLTEAGLRSHSDILKLENHSLKSSLKRTAHLLTVYGKDFGEKKNAAGIKIKLNLTHQDIADILNLTRETVSSNMHKLQQKNLIKNGRSMILVRDLTQLENEAYR